MNVNDASIKDEWFEVWADDTLEPPYVLLVVKRPKTAEIAVIDPAERYSNVFASSDYEEVKLWLLEDEYTRVTGRMMEED